MVQPFRGPLLVHTEPELILTNATSATGAGAERWSLQVNQNQLQFTTDATVPLTLQPDGTVQAQRLSGDGTALTVAGGLSLQDALANKVETAAFTAALAQKVDTTTFDAALDQKVDTTTFTAELDQKVDTTRLNAELALKVDTTTFTEALNQKVDTTTFTAELDQKVDTTRLNTELALKVDTTTFTEALNQKVDTARFDTALNAKVDTTTFNTALADKLDRTGGNLTGVLTVEERLGIGLGEPTATLSVMGNPWKALTGVVSVFAAPDVEVEGFGTNFREELVVGDAIKIQGEVRIVEQIDENEERLTINEGLSQTVEQVQAFTDSDLVAVKNGVSTQFLVVDKNGKMGIGVDEPREQLDILGNIRASGDVRASTIQASSIQASSNIKTSAIQTSNLQASSNILASGNIQASGDIRANKIIRSNSFRPLTNDWEITRVGENLEIREPEQSDKVWLRLNDDRSLHLIGTPHLWVDGNIGVRTTSPRARIDLNSPWGDWIFLRQERDRQGGGGFVIHNPWGNSNRIQGATSRNRLEIGYRLFTGSTRWGLFVLHSGGNVGIGTVEPRARLHVNGTAMKPGGGSWTNSSDARLKRDVKPLTGTLDRLLKLRGVSYAWKEPEKQGELTGTQIGMIAQEVEPVFPEWIGVDSDGYKNLTFRGFEALTVEALRELKIEHEILKANYERLRAELAALAHVEVNAN